MNVIGTAHLIFKLKLMGNQKPFAYCLSFELDLVVFYRACLKRLFPN